MTMTIHVGSANTTADKATHTAAYPETYINRRHSGHAEAYHCPDGQRYTGGHRRGHVHHVRDVHD